MDCAVGGTPLKSIFNALQYAYVRMCNTQLSALCTQVENEFYPLLFLHIKAIVPAAIFSDYAHAFCMCNT